MGNREYGLGAYLLSFAFIIWFFGSIVGMIYFSNHDQTPLTVVLFGQLFLIFGIIIVACGIKNHSFQPITVIFPLVGILAIAGGLIYYVGSKSIIAYVEKILPELALSAFFIIGAAVVVGTYLSSLKKRNLCSYTIMATCVDMKSHVDDGTLLECPVYEIYFRGEMLQLCNENYSNMNKVAPGETREIHINPDNPTEFYEEKMDKTGAAILYVIGGTFMIMSLIAFYMMHVYG